MIENLKYEEILKLVKELRENSDIVDALIKGKGQTELEDFISTVEGYSKYLETIIELNQDADKALEALKNAKK